MVALIFIALDIDPDNAAHWSDVPTNDTIRFVSLSSNLQMDRLRFPQLKSSPRGDHGRRFDVRFGTEKSQLIRIVSHAEKSVLSIRLYAILPTQKPGQAYWYFDDRRLGDQERSALRAELREFETHGSLRRVDSRFRELHIGRFIPGLGPRPQFQGRPCNLAWLQ